MPKAEVFRGIQGMLPQSPLSWVSESFEQGNGQFHSPRMKPCNLESIFFIKNISILKNLTDFYKMVESGVDPHLQIS